MSGGRGRHGRGSRTGTVLVLAGILGVLSATFLAGLWTGRHWPVLTGTAPPGPPADSREGRRTPGERPKQAEPMPALTFYHELTAPLTAPPPPPRPTRPPRPAGKSGTVPPPASGAQFTVQVGSYNVPTPAEALRATLAAAGHDVRVVAAETPGGVRYRVQVGSFPSREAAREAAARLTAERSMPAFATAR